MKRALKRCAWILLVLLIAAVAAWTGANVYGSQRLKSTLQDLEESGYRTTAPALAPSPLPRSQNAAPFYTAAFALMEKADDEEHALLDDALAGGAARLSDARRAALAAWIDRNADTLELSERARKRPRCLFERNYNDGFRMLLPELSPALQLGRLLQVRAELQALAGDGPGARGSVHAILRLADAFREDPPLVSQLVRLQIAAGALSAVDRAVTGETPEAELRAWAETVRTAGAPHGMLEVSMRHDLAMTADLIRNPPDEVWSGLLGSSRLSVLFKMCAPLMKLDGAACLHAYRALADAAARPHREADAAAATLQAAAQQSSWRRPLRAVLLPSLGRIFGRCIAVDARAAVVRAGLEAERVRRSTGAYPEKIEAVDPATGKPLLYDRAEGRIASAAASKEEPIEWRLRGR